MSPAPVGSTRRRRERQETTNGPGPRGAGPMPSPPAAPRVRTRVVSGARTRRRSATAPGRGPLRRRPMSSDRGPAARTWAHVADRLARARGHAAGPASRAPTRASGGTHRPRCPPTPPARGQRARVDAACHSAGAPRADRVRRSNADCARPAGVSTFSKTGPRASCTSRTSTPPTRSRSSSGARGRLRVHADHRADSEAQPGQGQRGVRDGAAEAPAAWIVRANVPPRGADDQHDGRPIRAVMRDLDRRIRARRPPVPGIGVDRCTSTSSTRATTTFSPTCCSRATPDRGRRLLRARPGDPRRVQANYEDDTLIEAIAGELERDHGFTFVTDDRLDAAVHVSANSTKTTSSHLDRTEGDEYDYEDDAD